MRITRSRRPASDAGMSVIELLVVIALVGVMASLVLPIVVVLFGAAQQDADARTLTHITDFVSSWTASGYPVQNGAGQYAGEIVAVDPLTGNTVAMIKGNI